jgi:hypothetical protein
VVAFAEDQMTKLVLMLLLMLILRSFVVDGWWLWGNVMIS